MIIEMTFNKDKYQFQNNDSNEIVKDISSQEKKENKSNNGKYLGRKRKLFKKKKNSKKNKKNKNNISKSKSTILNKNVNCETHEICIICLDTISFQNKHFLHCGHNFHCSCITHWINDGNNLCPICKQNIKCNYIFNDEPSINLDEDENNINNNVNNNNENNIIRRNNNSYYSQQFEDILYSIIGIVFIYLFIKYKIKNMKNFLLFFIIAFFI